LIDNFRIDPFQAGAGTSHNMNANEVLATGPSSCARGRRGSGKRGDYSIVSPNDHVNMDQSTNDVFPTSMRIATLDLIRDYMPRRRAHPRLEGKAREFDDVIKSAERICRTPFRSARQEFAAYALTLRRDSSACNAGQSISEQNIGATAVGTGLNAEPEYIELVVRYLAEQTGHHLRVPSISSRRPSRCGRCSRCRRLCAASPWTSSRSARICG